jgi:glycyl-tRNA synthetase
MSSKARALYEELRRAVVSEYDDSGQVGRRYRRQDEIGTPYALTIDEQTLKDDMVTIRDRDSLAQERIPISGASDFVLHKLSQDWQTPKAS